jgi:hypothetical protein
MIGAAGGAGATGRGPATAAFCVRTLVTRAGTREATETAGLISFLAGALAGRFAAAVWCAGLTRRCLCLAGTVLAKPVAARR